ncbi:heterokaryon incompatibility protein-domain-containing protein [Lasiosphaeris hirsuta]|uniref:Heterokaryon incompatibility protein-domain-containing protein n=1 Tax=Lasiosphaeris hirsuta TaxID=260670 RepID=A0AA40DSZ4_9PEZI|nr:heterokaryon incompatibility protein-domain-containing protein [Lasiosphaeris hirsuta]
MSTCSSIYHSLKGTEIRLIRLKPRQPGDDHTLNLDLIHVELDSNPHFHALSYAWDDSAVRKRARVNGVSFEITPSLHAALTYLQSTCLGAHDAYLLGDETDLLWIDAICVDQSDQASGSRQVPRAGDICASACEVIPWIGAKEGTGDLGRRLSTARSQPAGDLRPDLGSVSRRAKSPLLGSSSSFSPGRKRLFVQGALPAKSSDSEVGPATGALGKMREKMLESSFTMRKYCQRPHVSGKDVMEWKAESDT